MKRTAISVVLAVAYVLATPQVTATSPLSKLTIETPKQYAKRLSEGRWSRSWVCLRELWHRESRWNPKADNPRSSAYGIPQILGLDPSLNALQQIDRGLDYIQHRYGHPCRALDHHNRRGYY
jgi:hypothetical protein